MPASLPPVIPPEDFWSRQRNAQTFSFDFAPFGVPTEITANDPASLTAAQISARRFSRTVDPSGEAMRVQIVVGEGEASPLPNDLPDRLKYSGVGDRISLSAGDWGYGFGNLITRQATVFLSPSLAANPLFVSRYFIDHYLLNFLLTDWAMLHASCVIDRSGRRLLMLIGPHNTGKSTAALRLTRAGYAFLADGMVLLKARNNRLVVGGYPVGEVKLRDDMLVLFPEYADKSGQAREHTKTIVDLRAAHPDRLAESLFVPPAVVLCFVERGAHTTLPGGTGKFSDAAPLTPEAALDIVAANTMYWNYPAQLAHNTDTLHYLLRHASLYRLTLGSDPIELISTVDRLT
jgi:hypothetical protein